MFVVGMEAGGNRTDWSGLVWTGMVWSYDKYGGKRGVGGGERPRSGGDGGDFFTIIIIVIVWNGETGFCCLGL